MSQKIKIVSIKGRNTFDFLSVGYGAIPTYMQYKCQTCGIILSRYYSLIIDKLKEAKLIDENHPTMCCYCFVINKALGFANCKECGHYLHSVYERASGRYYRCGQCGEIYVP